MQEEMQEPTENIPAPTLDMHRAIVSLTQELVAIDAYTQRYEACTDPELRLILANHRDKKKQHAAMLLEWMRRRDPKWDHYLRDALFKAGPITAQYKSAD